MIRVCIAGITGWVGEPLAAAVRAADDLVLVMGVARRSAGQAMAGVPVVGSVQAALGTPFDVLVDYTSAVAVKANVLAAIDAGRHVVVGSSGLTDEDVLAVDQSARARGVGVIVVGNFAISAALLQRFAADAARYLSAWEILDFANADKIDAPSGTAREVAWRLAQVRKPDIAIAREDTVGVPDARGALVAGSPVHSIRLPGHTIGVQVRFGQSGERLTIEYEGGPGAEPYLAGTLLAVRRVGELRGVVRGLDALL